MENTNVKFQQENRSIFEETEPRRLLSGGVTVTDTMTAADVDDLTESNYSGVNRAVANETADISASPGALAFTPTEPNWFGSDSFTFTVADDLGATTQVVNNNLYNVDGLADGTCFSVTSAASHGKANINTTTGAWTFTPTDPDWFGSDSFTVAVTDDLGVTTTRVVNLTFANVDGLSVIGGDINHVGSEGNTGTGTMIDSDIDGQSDGTYFSISTAAIHGVAAINPTTGVWTFTPTDPNWLGSDSCTVTITDDLGGSSTQVVSITLANVGDYPATVGGDITSGTMTASDVDDQTDGVYSSITCVAANGNANIDAASDIWNFTSNDENWFGTDSFTVTATDDMGGTTTQFAGITPGMPNLPASDDPKEPEPNSKVKSGDAQNVGNSGGSGDFGDIVTEEILAEDDYSTPQIRIPEQSPEETGKTIPLVGELPDVEVLSAAFNVNKEPEPEEAENGEIEIVEDESRDDEFEQAFAQRAAKLNNGIEWNENLHGIDQVDVKIMMGTSLASTAGVNSWKSGGGSLLASVLSTAPLFQPFDPLPINARRSDQINIKEDDDEETTPESQNARRVDNLFEEN